MSTDTDHVLGELRARLDLDGLHSGLDPQTVLIRSRRARRRRTALSSLVAVAAVAAAAVGGPAVASLSHRVAAAAHDARWAQVDGAAGDLSVPLHVAWRADGSLAGLSQPGAPLLLETADGFTAVDPSTGHALWTFDVDTDRVWCQVYASDARSTGGTVGTDGPARALCTDRDAGTLQVRDLSTGDVVRTITVDWTDWAAQIVDSDVIAGGHDDDHPVATRWSVETGAVVWTYRGDSPLPVDDQGLLVNVGPSSVDVFSGSTGVRLDAGTGAQLPYKATSDVRWAAIAGGATAIEESAHHGGPDQGVVRVEAADGTVLLTVPGLLGSPAVDDASMPGLVFVTSTTGSSAVQAIDANTRRELWSRPGISPIAIVDETVVARTPSGKVEVLNAHTGDILWAKQGYQPESETGWEGSVTDGDAVLTVEGEPGQTALVARALTTGAILWAAPWDVADGTRLYALPDGTVIALAHDHVTGLTP